MPRKSTIEKARRDARQGKAPSTQAGEFVREEIEHVRAGKHGAKSAKQTIAIGLSKARKAGVKLPPAPKDSASGTAGRPARRKPQRRAAAGADASPRSDAHVGPPAARQAPGDEDPTGGRGRALNRARGGRRGSQAARSGALVGGPDALVHFVDRPAGVDHDDAVFRHVPGQVLVKGREGALHLVLLVELGRLAAVQAPFGGRLRGDVEHDREVRTADVAIERSDPLDRVLGVALLETLW